MIRVEGPILLRMLNRNGLRDCCAAFEELAHICIRFSTWVWLRAFLSAIRQQRQLAKKRMGIARQEVIWFDGKIDGSNWLIYVGSAQFGETR